MKVFDFSEQLADLYLEWANNYLSVSRFAEDYRISEETALDLIYKGMEYHEKRVNYYNGDKK